MTNGDQRKTEKKKKLKTLRPLLHKELLEGSRQGAIQRKLKIQEFSTHPKYLPCTKKIDFPDS